MLENRGIGYGALETDQQEMLVSLLEEYAGTHPAPVAQERLRRIRDAGLDRIVFAWMGGLEKRQGHYYRIQGRTFLVEYDNTQNDANHIHAVWRDFDGDFGRDLLAEHYRSSDHRDPFDH